MEYPNREGQVIFLQTENEELSGLWLLEKFIQSQKYFDQELNNIYLLKPIGKKQILKQKAIKKKYDNMSRGSMISINHSPRITQQLIEDYLTHDKRYEHMKNIFIVY